MSRIPDEIYAQVWSAGELAAQFIHRDAPRRRELLDAAQQALEGGDLDALADALRGACAAFREPIAPPQARRGKPRPGIDNAVVRRLRAALAEVELLRAGCWRKGRAA